MKYLITIFINFLPSLLLASELKGNWMTVPSVSGYYFQFNINVCPSEQELFCGWLVEAEPRLPVNSRINRSQIMSDMTAKSFTAEKNWTVSTDEFHGKVWHPLYGQEYIARIKKINDHRLSIEFFVWGYYVSKIIAKRVDNS